MTTLDHAIAISAPRSAVYAALANIDHMREWHEGTMEGEALRRDGARVGDDVWLVGSAGGAAADLRALQVKVADLDATVRSLDAAQARLGDRQLDEFDRVRTAVAAATDDLMARVTALADRVDADRLEEQR